MAVTRSWIAETTRSISPQSSRVSGTIAMSAIAAGISRKDASQGSPVVGENLPATFVPSPMARIMTRIPTVQKNR